MGIPLEGQNTYYSTDSYNTIWVNLLNPLSVLSNFQVTITYPLIPTPSGGDYETQPEYKLSDFLVWGRTFRDYLDDENSFLYPLYQALVDLAKEALRYDVIRSEKKWKQLVSLYVAHYLELMLNAYKDEANRANLNPYEKDKDTKYEMVLGNIVFEEFKTTTYGKIFWQFYRAIGGWELRGVL